MTDETIENIWNRLKDKAQQENCFIDENKRIILTKNQIWMMKGDSNEN